MGLTVHYNVFTKEDLSCKAVRSILDRIRIRAKSLLFASIGEIEVHGDRGSTWMDFRCREQMDLDGSIFEFQPVNAMGFNIDVGDGSEGLGIILAQYPKTVKVSRRHPDGSDISADDCRASGVTPQRLVRTNLKNWRGHGFCKTQYASDPEYGGVINFLKCHLSVIHLLEFMQLMPELNVEIDDEGKYGSSTYTDDPSVKNPVYYSHPAKHDVVALAQEVGEWNEMMAASFGTWKDLLGELSVDLVAPIRNYSDFEHLEARGANRKNP